MRLVKRRWVHEPEGVWRGVTLSVFPEFIETGMSYYMDRLKRALAQDAKQNDYVFTHDPELRSTTRLTFDGREMTTLTYAVRGVRNA